MRIFKRRSCLSSLMENQYLRRMMPEREEHLLELGHGTEELLQLARCRTP
jgi:hypothetical protein